MEYQYLYLSISDIREDKVKVLLRYFTAGWKVVDKTITKQFILYILERPLEEV